MTPLEHSWNKKTYQAMAMAYTKQHLWVKIFTVFSGLSCLLNILSFNIFSLAISGMILFACLKAWQSLTLFESATQLLEYQQGLHSLRDYLKWQTIGLGIGFALLLGIIVFGFFALALIFTLGTGASYA